MSATLTERAGTGVAPPARPSFWKVGWATFLGYLLTMLLGLPFALALGSVGIDVTGAATSGRGVFERYDVWSWLAEACVGLVATFVTAHLVGSQLRDRTGWEVPFGFVFVTLLVTGYAPLLALTPFYWAAAPISLGVAALILRWRAEPSGGEPRTTLGAVPRRYRRAAAIILALAGPLMFAYVAAYGATHPLHLNSSSEGPAKPHEPGKLSRYTLWLEDTGAFAVTDLSIVRVEGSPTLQLERAGIEANRCTPPPGRDGCQTRLRPLTGLDLETGSGSGDSITLELRQGRVCPPGIASLDAVWVRYTVLDMRHEQRIRLEHPPEVRCP